MMTLINLHRTVVLALVVTIVSLVTMGAGCSSDPNVEGAKLDLRNKDYDRAIVNLDKALVTNPNNYEAYCLKGQVYQEMVGVESDVVEHTELVALMRGSYTSCLDALPAEETVMRDDVIARNRLAWYNEYQRGLAHYNRESFDDAAVFFTNATELEPDSAATYVNLAFAYIQGERSSEAITPLETALEKGDSNPDTYNYLSDLYLEVDRTDDAVALLTAGRVEFPDNAEITARLFNAYTVTGQVEEALKLADKTVTTDPDNPLHRYNYGSLLLTAEQYDEAVDQLEKAIELDAEYTSALFNLGAAYQNKGVALNSEVTALDEEIRSGDLSNDDVADATAKMEAAAAERDRLFELSIEPLSKARELSEMAGDDVTGICTALGQAYARTNDMEKAQEAYDCAEGGGE